MLYRHFQQNIVRGLLAIVPLLLTIIALELLYVLIDRRVAHALEIRLGLPSIPGLGFLLLAVFLYLLGLLASNVVGKTILELVHALSHRLSIVGWLYRFGRELSLRIQLAGVTPLFQKAVLVQRTHDGQWLVGFYCGDVINNTRQERLMKVVIPMAHPTVSFVFLIDPSRVKDSGMTIDEALKMVVSAGLISPRSV